jgi:hypothetical protein
MANCQLIKDAFSFLAQTLYGSKLASAHVSAQIPDAFGDAQSSDALIGGFGSTAATVLTLLA